MLKAIRRNQWLKKKRQLGHLHVVHCTFEFILSEPEIIHVAFTKTEIRGITKTRDTYKETWHSLKDVIFPGDIITERTAAHGTGCCGILQGRKVWRSCTGDLETVYGQGGFSNFNLTCSSIFILVCIRLDISVNSYVQFTYTLMRFEILVSDVLIYFLFKSDVLKPCLLCNKTRTKFLGSLDLTSKSYRRNRDYTR